ncbi:MAG: DUF1573 domain-containing protein [Bacteroidetes bacterium]|nr:DUF1573 domain-containing protein [Bacteroidota bacterium]
MQAGNNFILSILVVFLIGVSCTNETGNVSSDVVHNPITASGKGDMEDLPVFEFRETLHDFGTIIEGEKVTYSFKFKNTGKMDLVISNVSASCGCTATSYPKDPVPPGGENVISVTFDSRRRRGFQNKTVTVAANTQPNKTVLRIKAKIISPDDL